MMPRTLVLASLVASVALAQSAPPKRAHHSLIYDPVRQRVLLTGGSTPVGDNAFTFFNDLWAFDGTRWTELPASGEKLSGTALAFDAQRSRVMSFGGYAGGLSLGDVRLLDSAGWRSVGKHPEIIAAEAGFVYDTRRNRFVAFGGSPGPRQEHGATWEFDGVRWIKLAGNGPPARQSHVMVYDAKRGRVVVFGGMGAAPQGQSPLRNDVWEFDGSTWIERAERGPSPRIGVGATYDSKRGVTIIFGGLGPDGFFGDTWSWDGTAWKKLADTGPEPRGMGYLAYDARRDRTVLFGGRKGYPNGDLNDTWEWDGSAWKQIHPAR